MNNHNKLIKTECDDAFREVRLTQKAINETGETRGLWYESPEVVESKLRHGKLKAARMTWVLRQMDRRLDVHERQCVELYYFEGLSFREVAAATGTTRSGAMRVLRGAIAKLRTAARLSGIAAKAGDLENVLDDAE